MWTGLLGSLDYGPCGAATLVPNYVLISICCGTFYFLLRCDCMLIVPNYVLISICCGTFYFLLRCDCMLITC